MHNPPAAKKVGKVEKNNLPHTAKRTTSIRVVDNNMSPAANNAQQGDSEPGTSASHTAAEEETAGEWTVVNRKNSPNFVCESLSTPRYMEFAKAENIKTATRILPSGKQVVSCSYEDRVKVGAYLQANSTGGHTHTSNEDRPGSSLVKGIHRDYSPEFVKERLEELASFKIKEAKHFQKTLSEGEKPLHWWIITTEKREDALNLKLIKFFEHAAIKWEPLKSTSVIRCYKCQRFSHMAPTCYYEVRCGRCTGKHLTKFCTVLYMPKTSPRYKKYKCANCECVGHPAYDKDCPSYRAEEARRQRAKDESTRTKEENRIRRQQNRQRQQAPTAADFSVNGLQKKFGPRATITSAPPPATNAWTARQQPGVSGATYDRINADARRFFNKSPAQILKIISDYEARDNILVDPEEKKMAYVQFLSTLNG